MKCVVVSSSKLGLNCWLPYRFIGCFLCDRYLTCRYPERVQSVEYDRLVRCLKDAKEQVTKCEQAIVSFKEEWD